MVLFVDQLIFIEWDEHFELDIIVLNNDTVQVLIQNQKYLI